MNVQLLDILVCPICKGPLQHDKKALELICNADRLAFPIRDGIPIMWTDQARELHNSADATGNENIPPSSVA